MRLSYLHLGLATSLAALAISAATAASSNAEPQRLGEARFNGWQYTVVADPQGQGATRASIEFDHSDVAALKRYVTVNQALAHELAVGGRESLPITVSFREPISVAEFRAWAARTGMTVEGFQVRLTGSDARRWTLGGTPTSGQLVADADLQRSLDKLASKGATEMRGVIVAEGSIGSVAYDRLASDRTVFLADVTRAATAEHIARTVRGVDAAKLSVAVAPVYASMEDLGLDNFR